jgi:hypothetical protein
LVFGTSLKKHDENVVVKLSLMSGIMFERTRCHHVQIEIRSTKLFIWK